MGVGHEERPGVTHHCSGGVGGVLGRVVRERHAELGVGGRLVFSRKVKNGYVNDRCTLR